MAESLDQARADQASIPYGKIGDIGGKSTDYMTGTAFPLVDSALKSYAMFQRSQEKPLDIYNALEDLAGLPQLRKTASSLQGSIGDVEDALSRVEPDVSLRSRNSLVTEAQRRGMVEAASKPLRENLADLSTSLGRVQSGIQSGESNLGTKVGLVMQGQAIDRDTYKLEFDTMSNRAAQLISGFNDDRQYEYNFLMDKLQRQRVLADEEYTRLAELQKMKVAHDYELENIRAQGDQAMRSAQYQASLPATFSVGSGSKTYMYTPSSGNIINSFGGGGGGTGSGNLFGGTGGGWY